MLDIIRFILIFDYNFKNSDMIKNKKPNLQLVLVDWVNKG